MKSNHLNKFIHGIFAFSRLYIAFDYLALRLYRNIDIKQFTFVRGRIKWNYNNCHSTFLCVQELILKTECPVRFYTDDFFILGTRHYKI